MFFGFKKNDENELADGEALKPAGSIGLPIFVSQNMFQHKIFSNHNDDEDNYDKDDDDDDDDDDDGTHHQHYKQAPEHNHLHRAPPDVLQLPPVDLSV